MELDRGFIGDIHFGHKTIAKIRGFDDVDEYNEEAIRRYNSVMGKHSIGFLFGDIAMENHKYYHLLDRMNGQKVVILGNHELPEDVKYLLPHITKLGGAIEYKGFIFTHVPIHVSQVGRYRGNVHGHTHEEIMMMYSYNLSPPKVTIELDPRYQCVSWDILNGVPIGFDALVLNFEEAKAKNGHLIKNANTGAVISQNIKLTE